MICRYTLFYAVFSSNSYLELKSSQCTGTKIFAAPVCFPSKAAAKSWKAAGNSISVECEEDTYSLHGQERPCDSLKTCLHANGTNPSAESIPAQGLNVLLLAR